MVQSGDMRPKMLREVVLARGFLSVLGLSYVQAATIPTTSALMLVVPFLAFQVVVLWFLWHGRNWARLATIVMSLLAILSVQSFGFYDALHRILPTIDIAFSIWLIYWLTRPPIRAYFRPDLHAA
jgi:hypothetical protein